MRGAFPRGKPWRFSLRFIRFNQEDANRERSARLEDPKSFRSRGGGLFGVGRDEAKLPVSALLRKEESRGEVDRIRPPQRVPPDELEGQADVGLAHRREIHPLKMFFQEVQNGVPQADVPSGSSRDRAGSLRQNEGGRALGLASQKEIPGSRMTWLRLEVRLHQGAGIPKDHCRRSVRT